MLLRGLQNWDQVSKLLCVIYRFAVQGIFSVLLKAVSLTQSDLKCTRNYWKRLSISVKVKLRFVEKEMQSSIFRLMLTSLMTTFLTSAKKLKFISVFVKSRIRKTIRTFRMRLLTVLENIQTKLPISLRLVWLRHV